MTKSQTNGRNRFWWEVGRFRRNRRACVHLFAARSASAPYQLPPESIAPQARPHQAGGLTDFSRWLRARQRPTPPENVIKKTPHPGGVPETGHPRIWHPSGMRYFSRHYSGGIARRASLNHRLKSGKPPACRRAQRALLEFGIFLEFGIWNLEFPPHPCHQPPNNLNF